MGSMLGRSVMEKNSTDPWAATGRYPARDCSILRSVSSATYKHNHTQHTCNVYIYIYSHTHAHTQYNVIHTFCFLEISFDKALDESRIWMAVSSSRMFPSEADRVSSILSSISFSCFLLAALCTMRVFLSSSSSGLQVTHHMYPQSLLPLFPLSPLLGHHYPQQLILKTLWSDHEVEQRHLG